MRASGEFGERVSPRGIPYVRVLVPNGEVRIETGGTIVSVAGTPHQLSIEFGEGSAGKYHYAEFYNGLGYHQRGVPSSYVWSGTDQYKSGKYVADGKYSASTKDTQLGVMAMMEKIDKADAKKGDKKAS